MKKSIKLGYEVGTGEQIDVPLSHMVVTGVSQESGKTTTLEALITRSKKKAIVFKTKIGEKSFIQGRIIPPFFKDRGDWRYIESLISATIKEKLTKMDRSKIIQLCKKTSGKSLLDFKKVVDNRLLEKINSFETDILTNLQAYLDIVLPKLQTMNFSDKLELVDGVNIIDLERFSRDSEVQSLVIASVVEEVLHNHKDVIVVIPESWKVIPQKRGSPCKLPIEEFIRQGAANKNYIWIDSQDMAGVDKAILKQVSTWILGYQSEINEVKHTLDQLPIPKSKRPKTDEIMSLGLGKFILATKKLTTKIYVQPIWIDDIEAENIAKQDLDPSSLDIKPPEVLIPNKIAIKKEEGIHEDQLVQFKREVNKELSEMSDDFWKKITNLQEQIQNVAMSLGQQKPQEIDYELIVRKVIQKIPVQKSQPYVPVESGSNIDEEALIKKILAKVPSGAKIYEVAPIEKIKKDFLKEAKDKILTDISNLSVDAKKLLKYIESRNEPISTHELVTKCLLLKNGGTSRSKVAKLASELISAECIKKEGKGSHIGMLKYRIESLTIHHGASGEEIQQVYDHILMELLG